MEGKEDCHSGSAGHNYAKPAHSLISIETRTNQMMMRAVERAAQLHTKGNGTLPEKHEVASFARLPDYLGICRKLLEDHEADAKDKHGACSKL